MRTAIGSASVSIRIERVGVESAGTVFATVTALLRELGAEAEDVGELDEARLRRQWAEASGRFQVFVARAATGEIAGLATLSETFAIYANGNYGVIDEMYVSPAFRSQGLGKQLIDAIKAFGRDKGWARIDVTAPEGEGWERTRRFYEREGFSFAGPKLKFPLG
jgi:GNAT superfamily N-acetyltransferase